MNTLLVYKPGKERNQALLLLVITATLWSLGGLLIKSVAWNPVSIAGTRSLIAAALMLIYCRKPHFNWSKAQIGGAVAYAGTVIMFVTATKMTTAANAILLQYTAPIYTAIFGAWFLKERTSKLDWLTIALVFVGMGLFFVDKISPGNLLGNIIAIVSGVSFAGTALFLRKQKDGSPLESLILGNLVTGLIGIPFMFQSFPTTMANWFSLAALGIFQLGISYILYSKAIKHVTALEAILIPIIEPILNPIWVFLFMGEVPGPWALVGGAIVLFSVTGRCVLVALKERTS